MMGLLDNGSEMKNDEDDDINNLEDVSWHGNDAMKAADERQRRKRWAIAQESLSLICLLQAAFILNC